ncbi:MAG TPA: cell wall hydrolase [Candidatus Eisenbergiella merdavium]|uniref:Cell wall hydrolase n=1 Tax=Candidatus Eisenbergiella merdavium TaxID=2838551 RepID=A0A9D2SNT4_9FIRM|nr:cell wall hydrolase [Candidatus Eisenbergiella merdavium]
METRAFVPEGTKVSSVAEMREKCTPADCLARMILGEAGNQPINEMYGIAYVAHNRLQFPAEFGSTIKDIVLQGNGSQFNGITLPVALDPTTHSAWSTCLHVAKFYLSNANPIGHCLWFNTTTLYNSILAANGGKYKFPGTSRAVNVVREITLGNAHTFFLVEGYDF